MLIKVVELLFSMLGMLYLIMKFGCVFYFSFEVEICDFCSVGCFVYIMLFCDRVLVLGEFGFVVGVIKSSFFVVYLFFLNVIFLYFF